MEYVEVLLMCIVAVIIAKSVQDGIYSGYSESSYYDIKFYPESKYNEDDKLVFYIA